MIARFASVGSYVPDLIVFNTDLEANLNTSDEWIRKRTGILKRHLLSIDQSTSFMCSQAASMALARADMLPSDIDAIIVATCTPDKTFPGCANLVQRDLGCCNAFSFDIQAACAGFIYALTVANNFVVTGQVKNIMVIGADAMSKIIDWTDRGSCILFGDGAGALILTRSVFSGTTDDCNYCGVISTHLYTDATLTNILYTTGGVSTTGNSGKIFMNGKCVFEHAVKKISEAILFALEKGGYCVEDVDHFILHQANIRILDLVAKNLNIESSKMLITIDQFANTSAASIPISWDRCQKIIKKGDLVMLAAVGAGFSYGSVLLRV